MTRLLLLLVVAVSWLEIPAAASPALSAGELFSCALDGGRVACRGFNRHGQLGGDRMRVLPIVAMLGCGSPMHVYYATGGQLVATVSGATVTATFANVPTELGSSGMFSSISGTVTCPTP